MAPSWSARRSRRHVAPVGPPFCPFVRSYIAGHTEYLEPGAVVDASAVRDRRWLTPRGHAGATGAKPSTSASTRWAAVTPPSASVGSGPFQRRSSTWILPDGADPEAVVRVVATPPDGGVAQTDQDDGKRAAGHANGGGRPARRACAPARRPARDRAGRFDEQETRAAVARAAARPLPDRDGSGTCAGWPHPTRHLESESARATVGGQRPSTWY